MRPIQTVQLSKQQAKTFLLNYHFINSTYQPTGKKGIVEVFKRIQSIQYDPLDVVGKNIDLVLQSRISGYKKGYINKLLYEDRILIDGWDKQMCVFQTKDFPSMHPIRSHHSEASRQSILKHVKFDVLDYSNQLLEILSNEGPKYSTELSKGASKKYFWGNTKPSNLTLDYLFHKGVIGISNRKNTQKQYDLIENLIEPENLQHQQYANEEEFIEYYLYRRIQSLGLFSNRSSEFFLSTKLRNKTVRTMYIELLIRKNLIRKCRVEGLKDALYIPSNYIEYDTKIPQKTSFLAPLDNLIWDRELVLQLFDYKYRWEVYTTSSKRVYGYYVLPIVFGIEFIGRIEFQLHRTTDPLEVRNIWYEPGFIDSTVFQHSLQKALHEFSIYLGASTYSLQNTKIHYSSEE